jgi:hypothetical protein
VRRGDDKEGDKEECQRQDGSDAEHISWILLYDLQAMRCGVRGQCKINEDFESENGFNMMRTPGEGVIHSLHTVWQSAQGARLGRVSSRAIT